MEKGWQYMGHSISAIFSFRLASWSQAIAFFGTIFGALIQGQVVRATPHPSFLGALVSLLQTTFLIGAVVQLVALPWLIVNVHRGAVPRGKAIPVCVTGLLFVAYVSYGEYVCALTLQCRFW